MRIISLSLCLALFACLSISAESNKQPVEKQNVVSKHSCPWNLDEFKKAPKFKWLDNKSKVYTLEYDGPLYKGEKTKVFAYYASPGTLAGTPEKDKNLPGVVCVHGGGGQAYAEWVELWAKRGYAAIAMDVGGSHKGREGYFHPRRYDNKNNKEIKDKWQYHAIARIMLANSLLREMKGVNKSNIGITGISWGGYLTCITAGVDNRYVAAVPVYGCGFLNLKSAWSAQIASMDEKTKNEWVNLWDPSNYLGSAEMPVFLLNGTEDHYYRPMVWAKTCSLPKKHNQRMKIGMGHSHKAGWAPKEIGIFMDSICKGGTPLPEISEQAIKDGVAYATVKSPTEIVSAEFNYTNDDPPYQNPKKNGKKFKNIPAKIENGKLKVSTPEGPLKIWFFTVKDNRGAEVSGELVIK